MIGFGAVYAFLEFDDERDAEVSDSSFEYGNKKRRSILER